MNSILKNPLTNAICIGSFSAFYCVLFSLTAKQIKLENMLYYITIENDADSFWRFWSAFLAAGHQKFIAITLLSITVFVILLLVTHRRSYDEYYMYRLINCLLVALVLTFVAIALLFLIVLNEPVGVVEKFMLFIVIHWTTVVLADFVYVLLCRRG